jgi:hypothetical protein
VRRSTVRYVIESYNDNYYTWLYNLVLVGAVRVVIRRYATLGVTCRDTVSVPCATAMRVGTASIGVLRLHTKATVPPGSCLLRVSKATRRAKRAERHCSRGNQGRKASEGRNEKLSTVTSSSLGTSPARRRGIAMMRTTAWPQLHHLRYHKPKIAMRTRCTTCNTMPVLLLSSRYHVKLLSQT